MTTIHQAARSCRRSQFSSIIYPVSATQRLLTRNVTTVNTAAILPKPRLDYRTISESIVYKSHNAFNRKWPLPVGALQSIARSYAEQKEISGQLDQKRHARSVLGDRIRQIMDPKEKQIALDDGKALKAEVVKLEEMLSAVQDTLLNLALQLPNDTHPDVPIGSEHAANVLSTHGPTPMPPNSARDHMKIGKSLGLFNFEAAAAVTGSSWYYLLGQAALLENALTNYAISIALKHGFQFVMTPDVVRADVAARCGFQPRDSKSDHAASQTYHIATRQPELVLSGTAEIPLAGLFANKIFTEEALPLRVVGLGRSFRAEAGARGTDTRGLYRVHQFTKVELFVVCGQDASERYMEEIRQVQTEIFEGLGIPFRVLDMPTEELGASAYRKYDMEAWMPGRGSWGEISSTSNCTDYQARRLHIRYRRAALSEEPSSSSLSPGHPAPSSVPFAHTLNGTAAAIPRLILALIENGARFSDKGEPIGFDLPVILRPFWLGTPDGVVRWI